MKKIKNLKMFDARLILAFQLFFLDAIVCWSGQLPYFVGMVEQQDGGNEYVADYGGKLECWFKHEPLRYATAEDGTFFVVFDSTNMTNSSEIEKLAIRFSEQRETRRVLLESSLKADKTIFPIPGVSVPVSAYKVEGSIPVKSLELMKSKRYSCCVERRENSTGSICAYLRFKQKGEQKRGEGAHRESSHQIVLPSTAAELDFISRNNTLYKVIMILLVSIFVLLLVMFALCIRFSLDDGRLSYRSRHQRPATVRSPMSPQLFTVSVPAQASMPKLSIARGDLYSRYNLNTTNVSLVDEAARTASDECLPPPPPYAELVVHKSRSLSG